MDLYYLKDFIGNVAVVTTILQFLSGALVCKQYVINRTTGESSPLPFICCIVSCILWLFYGAAKQDNKIILVNLIGIALMSAYTIVFYIFTFKKSLILKQCSVAAIIFFFVVVFAVREDDRDQLLNVTGYLASIFTLATIVAPMSKLFYVMKVKSTECLPFPLILMSFIVSSMWSLYGHITNDSFIELVNIIGTILAISQLSLFLIYPNKPQSPLLPKSVRI